MTPVASQARALEEIIDDYRRAKVPADLHPDGALRALLGSSAYYQAEEVTRAPYSEANISWPEGNKPVDTSPFLSPAGSEKLQLGCVDLLDDTFDILNCEAFP